MTSGGHCTLQRGAWQWACGSSQSTVHTGSRLTGVQMLLQEGAVHSHSMAWEQPPLAFASVAKNHSSSQQLHHLLHRRMLESTAGTSPKHLVI